MSFENFECNLNPNQNQLNLLNQFMNLHKELGHGTIENTTMAEVLWGQLTQFLNFAGPPYKTCYAWKEYWKTISGSSTNSKMINKGVSTEPKISRSKSLEITKNIKKVSSICNKPKITRKISQSKSQEITKNIKKVSSICNKPKITRKISQSKSQEITKNFKKISSTSKVIKKVKFRLPITSKKCINSTIGNTNNRLLKKSVPVPVNKATQTLIIKKIKIVPKPKPKQILRRIINKFPKTNVWKVNQKKLKIKPRKLQTSKKSKKVSNRSKKRPNLKNNVAKRSIGNQRKTLKKNRYKRNFGN